MRGERLSALMRTTADRIERIALQIFAPSAARRRATHGPQPSRYLLFGPQPALCEPELRPKCAATPTLTYKQSAHGLLSRDGSALRIDVFAKVRVDAAVLHRVGEQIAPSPYGLSATMCSHGLAVRF
jgi:hypothetical protein